MIENIPTLLKVFDTAKSTLSAFTGWKSKNKGDAKVIIEELKQNSRYLWLVIEEDVDIGKIVKELSTKEYDRLLKEGFNFNNLKNKKIAKYSSLNNTSLSSWQDKKTEALVSNIYDKIKDLKTKYPMAKKSKKTRWKIRVKNTQQRILLLLRHASN